MTEEPTSARPQKRDPRRRARVPTLPPAARSRAALGLDRAAGEGRFMLQRCDACGAAQWPPRDACVLCLAPSPPWRDARPGATVLAVSTVHVSPEPYFRERAPWRVGLLRLDAGPTAMAHLHPELARGDRARVALRLDKAGRGTLFGEPEEPAREDPRMRDMTADPRGRRVLIVDGTAATGPAIAQAMRDAGAALVLAGAPEGWTRPEGETALRAIDGVQILPLDVTDEESVREAAASLGGKTDILVNNAAQARPGDLLSRRGLVEARREVETGYLGLLRLAQAFGPVMRARGADGASNACAWVSLLPVGAVAPVAGWAAQSAAAAAMLSATLSLRGELAAGGVRVCVAFHGPLEEEWRQGEPPPQVAPAAVARAVVAMLRDGRDETWIGDVAEDARARRAQSAPIHDREAVEGFRR